jgi:hypothetical protein
MLCLYFIGRFMRKPGVLRNTIFGKHWRNVKVQFMTMFRLIT